MSPQAQRVAIAEEAGWRWTDAGCGYWKAPKSQVTSNSISGLPNYLSSLDAMAEAEKVLTQEQDKLYWEYLNDISIGRAHRATAAQRAEAFLRCLNLWEDAK